MRFGSPLTAFSRLDSTQRYTRLKAHELRGAINWFRRVGLGAARHGLVRRDLIVDVEHAQRRIGPEFDDVELAWHREPASNSSRIASTASASVS